MKITLPANNMEFSATFATTAGIDPAYLRNITMRKKIKSKMS